MEQNFLKKSEKIRQDIYSKMSPAQKWKETLLLRETAWKLKIAAIRTKNPNWDKLQIEHEVRKIFLYAVT